MSCLSVSTGKKLAPMCWVIPPASRACTLVFLSSSRSEVFPAFTCPNTHTIGWRVGISEFTFRYKLSMCVRVFWFINAGENVFYCLAWLTLFGGFVVDYYLSVDRGVKTLFRWSSEE